MTLQSIHQQSRVQLEISVRESVLEGNYWYVFLLPVSILLLCFHTIVVPNSFTRTNILRPRFVD